jgi:hypothetical protein
MPIHAFSLFFSSMSVLMDRKKRKMVRCLCRWNDSQNNFCARA